MNNEKFISIGLVSQETGVPKSLLKHYVDNGEIPALKTTRRLLFRLSAVQKALDDLAMLGRKENRDKTKR